MPHWLATTIGLCLAAAAAHGVAAQQPRYPYKERGDRAEGIEASHPTSGERLDLMSATIEHSTRPNGDHNTLGFFLDRDARVDVNVRNAGRFYRMHPLQVQYRAGLNRFSWPTEITAHYGLTKADLSALAVVAAAEQKTVAPVALLVATPEQWTGAKYRFVFVGNTTVDIRLRITRLGEVRPVYVDSLAEQPAGEDIEFTWTPRANTPRGLHVLSVDAVFKYRSSAPVRITQLWRFFHGF